MDHISVDMSSVSRDYYNKKQRRHRGLFKDGKDIYNSDAVGAFNIMRKYRQLINEDFPMVLKGLSNPTREYIPVTDQFLDEDFLNWNGKASNVGISGRNYPVGYAFYEMINECITQMLGNLIAE